MQIVIDIPEEMHKAFVDGMWCGNHTIGKAIANGTPLPKGHGRLIDADAFEDTVMKMNEKDARITRNDYKLIDNVIFEMPTIVEADKEREE